jgi:hypothetical protein
MPLVAMRWTNLTIPLAKRKPGILGQQNKIVVVLNINKNNHYQNIQL